MKKTVVGSVAGALRADPSFPEDWEKLTGLLEIAEENSRRE